MNRNRNRRNDSSEATEARIFRELFGTRLLVVENLWFLLDELSLHPEGGLPKHLLWALHFMVCSSRRVRWSCRSKDLPKMGMGLH
jgi:hypothetical protein